VGHDEIDAVVEPAPEREILLLRLLRLLRLLLKRLSVAIYQSFREVNNKQQWFVNNENEESTTEP